MVHRLAVIAPEECERVCASIAELRPLWTQRHETLPFFTLGVPSYIDATKGRFGSYMEAVARTNPIMAEHFGWLHARVNDALAAAGFTPTLHDPRLAYPGFHIYQWEDVEEQPGPGSIHYDLQYEHIDWSPHEGVDFSCPLSFTLTLRLPAGGGGLHLWDLEIHAVQKLPPEERRALLANKRFSTYHPYAPGEMVVHNGHHMHQIARLTQMTKGDARITLQGHAVATARGWVVYW